MKIRFWINIFLFIFIILLSINIFTKKIESKEEKSLTDINLNSINEIIIEVKNKKDLIFKKQNKKWVMNSPYNKIANQERIKSILEILEIKFYKKYDINKVNLVQFDLKNPKVLLNLNNNKFYFGVTNPIDQKRYVLFDENVYMIDDFIYPQLTTSPAFFIDNDVMSEN